MLLLLVLGTSIDCMIETPSCYQPNPRASATATTTRMNAAAVTTSMNNTIETILIIRLKLRVAIRLTRVP